MTPTENLLRALDAYVDAKISEKATEVAPVGVRPMLAAREATTTARKILQDALWDWREAARD